jgi:hypothetical protein
MKSKYRKKPTIVEVYQHKGDDVVTNGKTTHEGDFILTDGSGSTTVCSREDLEKDYEYLGDFLTFSQALDSLKDGKKVARRNWRERGMWLVLVTSKSYSIENKSVFDSEGKQESHLPYIAIRTQNNKIVPWVASHMDLLSRDWSLV